MTNTSNDHDLLIELKTKLDALIQSVNDIKTGVSVQLDDHEKRLRRLETNVTRILTYGSAAMVVLGLLDMIARLYFKAY